MANSLQSHPQPTKRRRRERPAPTWTVHFDQERYDRAVNARFWAACALLIPIGTIIGYATGSIAGVFTNVTKIRLSDNFLIFLIIMIGATSLPLIRSAIEKRLLDGLDRKIQADRDRLILK